MSTVSDPMARSAPTLRPRSPWRAVAAPATAGAVFVVALAALQAGWARRPPVAARTLGLRQLFLGLALVAVTAAGVALA